VLTYNCGSSSIKCRVVDPGSGFVALDVHAEGLDGNEAAKLKVKHHGHEQLEKKLRIDHVHEDLCEAVSGVNFVAVGHRVVHGGAHFHAPTIIDDAVKTRIREASVLAPLHNKVALQGIAHLQLAFPHLPQVRFYMALALWRVQCSFRWQSLTLPFIALCPS